MKKYLAIALLVMYLMSTTELNQLLKLPALVEHYNEHRSENSSLTFFEFLHMHYSQADDHDGDQDKDMKLPFKSHSLCCSANPVIVTLPEWYVFTSNLVIESSRKEVNYYRFLICPSPLKSIWQPPKIC